MTRAILAGLLVVGMAAACGDPTAPDDPTQLTYAPELGIDFSRMTLTDSGLYYQDTEIGTGSKVVAGDRVRVLYTGWLPDASIFDSNDDADNPLVFRVGLGQVIAGWDEGLLDMQPGGVRKLVIRPSLAYGKRSTGVIPANATLIFEVTFLGFDD